MTPEFHRELLTLSEADAVIALRVALSRIGTNENPVPKFRAIQRVMADLLQTGYPERPFVGQVLREMRADIGRRLERVEVSS